MWLSPQLKNLIWEKNFQWLLIVFIFFLNFLKILLVYDKTSLNYEYWCERFVVVQSLSRVQLFATPWSSMPGFCVLHHLLELAQTHVHLVGDAIQLSHPLSSSAPVLNLSQHPGSFLMSRLFTSGGQSIGVLASASFLPMNIQDWFPLGWTGWISLQSKELSRVFSNITV